MSSKDHGASRKPIDEFLSDLHCVHHCMSHRIRDTVNGERRLKFMRRLSILNNNFLLCVETERRTHSHAVLCR